jgi:RNA polymerase primary sigma factor
LAATFRGFLVCAISRTLSGISHTHSGSPDQYTSALPSANLCYISHPRLIRFYDSRGPYLANCTVAQFEEIAGEDKMKTNLNDELRVYLKEVSKHKVLSRGEEIELFERLAGGDESAREEIVEANLRFVVKIALSFAGRGVPIADLVQEGNIGLLEVVNKFDYRKGYRFSTYAAFWIRQAMQLALRKQSNVIRLPIRKGRFLGHLTEAINDFSNRHGRTPTNRELGLILQVDEEKIEQLMQLKDSVLSLDAEPDEDGAMLVNRLRDETTPSPFEKSASAEARERVARALASLSEKERRVLQLRYGFSGEDDMSLRSTSRIVGMSQEGVRRVERKALAKLRRPASRQIVGGLL